MNNMFYLLGLIYFLIILISLFGNNNARELEKDKRKWKEIFKEDYYG